MGIPFKSSLQDNQEKKYGLWDWELDIQVEE